MKLPVLVAVLLLLASSEGFGAGVVVRKPAGVNNRPIIGIVPVDTNSPYGKSFISATYVHYLEQAGARVVPIRGGQPEEYYVKMANYTNGVLFPGGAVNFKTSMYGRSAKILYDLAIKHNLAGDRYPMWGTCMGFQILCYLTEGMNLLKPTDSENLTLPLEFAPGFRSSRMFRDAPPEILQYLKTEPITQNEHRYSIYDQVFDKSSHLSTFFTKLSTNKGRKGTRFVSTVEAKQFPIYGTQWHPEKNNFNWNPKYAINHDEHAVKVSQYMANFFVSQARMSSHQFPSVISEAENLIQNYKRVYFPDGTFNDAYFIDT